MLSLCYSKVQSTTTSLSTKMASNLLKIHLQTIKFKHSNHSSESQLAKTFFQNISFPKHHLYVIPIKTTDKSKIPSVSTHCSLSSLTPPSTKEEAILQAKICLSTTLEKPLNNPKLAGKLKKSKQPRLRVEIPVIDDSPGSLTQLALDFFGDIPIKRKGSPVKILLIWPNPSVTESAKQAFDSLSSNPVQHIDVLSINNGETRNLSFAEVVVFLSPETSQLEAIKEISNNLYPNPVVLFNPKWGFDEETNFGELSGFVGSFEVVYSFMGLEVKGILSKRKGVIFKCVRDGVLSGETWSVLVEEGEELKVVSRFKARPSIGEVELVLYNLMAINSPITKSAKFLKDLVSNVTGKK